MPGCGQIKTPFIPQKGRRARNNIVTLVVPPSCATASRHSRPHCKRATLELVSSYQPNYGGHPAQVYSRPVNSIHLERFLLAATGSSSRLCAYELFSSRPFSVCQLTVTCPVNAFSLLTCDCMFYNMLLSGFVKGNSQQFFPVHKRGGLPLSCSPALTEEGKSAWHGGEHEKRSPMERGREYAGVE